LQQQDSTPSGSGDNSVKVCGSNTRDRSRTCRAVKEVPSSLSGQTRSLSFRSGTYPFDWRGVRVSRPVRRPRWWGTPAAAAPSPPPTAATDLFVRRPEILVEPLDGSEPSPGYEGSRRSVTSEAHPFSSSVGLHCWGREQGPVELPDPEGSIWVRVFSLKACRGSWLVRCHLV
jgi:hypothetical protein